MSIEYKYLPWSGRRYKVNQYGEVLNDAGEKIPSFENNGEQFVDLYWVSGFRTYSIGMLVLVAFGKLRLPDYLLDEVEVLYIDDNKKNLTPGNLIYRFKNGPLPVENFPGFFHIPMYADYALSERGELINIWAGKYKSWSVTKSGGPKNQTGGYLFSRVINDEGFSKTLFLHRAMCLVFLPYGRDVLNMVVNHKDGNPSNNTLVNLEWATYSENNTHAYELGLRPSAASPILMRDLGTEEILRFPSLSACARHLGNPRCDFIRHRLENCPTKVFTDMLMFKYDDGKPWPIVNFNEVEVCRLGHGGDIVARNIYTGETYAFTGTPSGEELTGVKAATILRHVRENTPIPVNGYNFRYLEFAKDWPIHSERHLQIYRKFPVYPPDGAIVTDTTTGEEVFYTSVAEATNALKITKGVFSEYARKEKLCKNRYLLKYFDIRKSYGPAVEESTV